MKAAPRNGRNVASLFHASDPPRFQYARLLINVVGGDGRRESTESDTTYSTFIRSFIITFVGGELVGVGANRDRVGAGSEAESAIETLKINDPRADISNRSLPYASEFFSSRLCRAVKTARRASRRISLVESGFVATNRRVRLHRDYNESELFVRDRALIPMFSHWSETFARAN